MRYLFDVGNTRVKWALEDEGRVMSSGAFLPGELDHFIGEKHAEEVSHVRISTVSSVEIRDKLIRWSADELGVQPLVAHVTREFLGLKVAYARVENLGVDRWLAMLAAWHKRNEACIVIDAGTTITVDYVGVSGVHAGGLIVPGVELMRGALFDRTCAVKVDKLSLSEDWSLGCDTVPCVSGGISAMITGFLSEIVQRGDENAAIILSGGDAKLVQSMLGRQAELRPHLVLEGLMCVS